MLFDRLYNHIIILGLVGCLWFAAFSRAAYDLWAASILFTTLTILALILCVGRMRDGKSLQFPLGFPLAVWLLTLWLSTRHSYDLTTSWLEFWGWFFCIVAFYLLINVTHRRADRDRFLTWGGMVVVLLAGICIWQQATRQPVAYSQLGSFRFGHWEIPGTLVNSMVLAGFLLYWFLFFVIKTMENSRFSSLLLASIVILVLARSFFAYAAVLLGIVLFYWDALKVYARGHPRLTVTAGLICLTVSLIVIYIKFFHQLIGIQLPIHDASARWYYWLAAIKIWQAHLVTGIGLGGFAIAYPYFRVAPVENTYFAHSFPLQLLAETGTVGMLAFLWVVLSYVNLRRKANIQAQSTPHTRIFEISMIVVLAYSLVTIQMDFLLNKLMLLFWVGMTLRDRIISTRTIPRLWLATAGLSLLLISPFWISLSVADQLYMTGIAHERKFILGNSGGEAFEEFDVGLPGGIPPQRLMQSLSRPSTQKSQPPGAGSHQPAYRQKAISLYQGAIAVAPFHAESYWRLSKIYETKYKEKALPDDLTAAQYYFEQAIRFKKDLRFLKNPPPSVGK